EAVEGSSQAVRPHLVAEEERNTADQGDEEHSRRHVLVARQELEPFAEISPCGVGVADPQGGAAELEEGPASPEVVPCLPVVGEAPFPVVEGRLPVALEQAQHVPPPPF